MTGPTSREQAVAAAGAWLADVLDDLDTAGPREAAQRATGQTAGPAVDKLEDAIRADRGLPRRHHHNQRGAA